MLFKKYVDGWTYTCDDIFLREKSYYLCTYSAKIRRHPTFPNAPSSPNEKTKFIHKFTVSCGLLSQVTNRRGDG